MGQDIPSYPRDYEPSWTEIMAAVKRPALYLNALIHMFILIPATCFIAWLAMRMDAHFGLEALIPTPLNYILFGILFPFGIYVVWYSYGYLAIKGEGSPGTHLGGTQKLVTSGIFTVCRHPSIIGKFIGVFSLGLLVGSPIFLIIVIPLLTTYSLVSVRYWQERHCEELWGDDYRKYRDSIPSVIPNPVTLFRFLTTSRHAAK